MATKVKFEINFVNKASKVISQLRDGLRVIQWQQFKTDYKDYVGEGKEFATNFELYAAFAEVWNAHPVQTMNVDEIKAFIDNLGYSLVDINHARSEYYERRNSYTATIKADVVSEEIPY